MNIVVNFTRYADDQAEIRQVVVGMGNPAIVIEVRADDDDSDDVILDIAAGHDVKMVAQTLLAAALAMDPEIEVKE